MVQRGALHLLLVADGSPEAIGAVDLLRALVDPTAIGRITIVAVADPFVLASLPLSWVWAIIGIVPQAIVEDARNVAASRAQESIRRELEALVGLAAPVETVLRTGSPAVEIVAAARAAQADIIVLGSGIERGLHGRWLHHVTQEVLQRAPCQVIVVHPHETVAPPTRGRRRPAAVVGTPLLGKWYPAAEVPA